MNKFKNLGIKSVHSIKKSTVQQAQVLATYEAAGIVDNNTLAIGPEIFKKGTNVKVGATFNVYSLVEYAGFKNNVKALKKGIKNGETLTVYPKTNEALVKLQVIASDINSFEDETMTGYKGYTSVEALAAAYEGDFVVIAGGEESLLHKPFTALRGKELNNVVKTTFATLTEAFGEDFYVGYHEHFTNVELVDAEIIAETKESLKKDITTEEAKFFVEQALQSAVAQNKRAVFKKMAKAESKVFAKLSDLNARFVMFFEGIMPTSTDTANFKEMTKKDQNDTVEVHGFNRHLLADAEIKAIATAPAYIEASEGVKALKATEEIYAQLNAAIEYTDTRKERGEDEYLALNSIVPAGYTDARTFILDKINTKFEGMKNTLANPEDYRARLNTEIEVLDNISASTLGINFFEYFLMVQDYLNFYKDGNIQENWGLYFPHLTKEEVIADGFADVANKDWAGKLGPGRGSAGGFLTSFMLDITGIDAMEYNLLMGRFINPERISAPDIDNDFEQSKRMFMIRYFKAKYGRDHVAKTVTYTMYKIKNSLQEGLRFAGVEDATNLYKDVLADELIIEDEVTLEHHLDINSSAYSDVLATLYAHGNEEFEYNGFTIRNFKKAMDIAIHLNGFIRGLSVHASAIFVTKEPVTNYGETFDVAQVDPMTGKDELIKVLKIGGYTAEEVGLLKFDILGLESLDVATRIEAKILERTGEEVKFEDLDIFDERIYDRVFTTANTGGVFQFESTSMKATLKQMFRQGFATGRDGFNFASMVTAAERPGAKAFIPELIETKEGETKMNPLFDEYTNNKLNETFGVMLYQETSMQIYIHFGATEGQADVLRKAMGKKNKELMAEVGEDFRAKGFETLQANGKTAEEAKAGAELLWSMIEKFAGYGFNKSHSDSYTIISTRMAAFKALYMDEFYLGAIEQTLSGDNNKRDKLANLVADMKLNGYTISKPSINNSEASFTIVEKEGVIGLGQVPTLKRLAGAIIAERQSNGAYKTFPEFIARMAVANVELNKAAIDNLIMSGAMDELIGLSEANIYLQSKVRNSLLKVATIYIDVYNEIKDTELTLEECQAFINGGFRNLTTKVAGNTKVNQMTAEEIPAFEKKNFGVYLSFDITEAIQGLNVTNWDNQDAYVGYIVVADFLKTNWGQKVVIWNGEEFITINDSKMRFKKDMAHKVLKLQFGKFNDNRYIKDVTVCAEINKNVNEAELENLKAQEVKGFKRNSVVYAICNNKLSAHLV